MTKCKGCDRKPVFQGWCPSCLPPKYPDPAPRALVAAERRWKMRKPRVTQRVNK